MIDVWCYSQTVESFYFARYLVIFGSLAIHDVSSTKAKYIFEEVSGVQPEGYSRTCLWFSGEELEQLGTNFSSVLV